MKCVYTVFRCVPGKERVAIATFPENSEAVLLRKYCEAARDSKTAIINCWDRGADGLRDKTLVRWEVAPMEVFSHIDHYLDEIELRAKAKRQTVPA